MKADFPTTMTINVEVSVSQGHDNPSTLPSWMYQDFPLQFLGYAISGYLAGIEVGRKVATANTRELVAAQIEAMRDNILGHRPEDEEARGWLTDAAALARGEDGSTT